MDFKKEFKLIVKEAISSAITDLDLAQKFAPELPILHYSRVKLST